MVKLGKVQKLEVEVVPQKSYPEEEAWLKICVLSAAVGSSRHHHHSLFSLVQYRYCCCWPPLQKKLALGETIIGRSENGTKVQIIIFIRLLGSS